MTESDPSNVQLGTENPTPAVLGISAGPDESLGGAVLPSLDVAVSLPGALSPGVPSTGALDVLGVVGAVEVTGAGSVGVEAGVVGVPGIVPPGALGVTEGTPLETTSPPGFEVWDEQPATNHGPATDKSNMDGKDDFIRVSGGARTRLDAS